MNKTWGQIAAHIENMLCHFIRVTGLKVDYEILLADEHLSWDDRGGWTKYGCPIDVTIKIPGYDYETRSRKKHCHRLMTLNQRIAEKYGKEVDVYIENPDYYASLNDGFHQATTHNRESIRQSQQCGCYYCERIFPASEVTDDCYIEGDTACCPYCGVDSVFGDASGEEVSAEHLKKLNRKWFD